ncbi:MAG: glutamine amidotransferase, partial [Thermoguttaceae bacterium]
QGAGLVMLGGWESFHGLLGEYDESPLAAVLPVLMQSCDDRRNFAQPCLIEKVADHEILAKLPWDRPPGIGGINAVTAKPGAETLLAAVQFSVLRTDQAYQFVPVGRAPLLIVGRYGVGRTAALATDVAPHWVGGFVDWGDRRIMQDLGGGMIEVGNWYARFFRNLVAWAGQLNEFRGDNIT